MYSTGSRALESRAPVSVNYTRTCVWRRGRMRRGGGGGNRRRWQRPRWWPGCTPYPGWWRHRAPFCFFFIYVIGALLINFLFTSQEPFFSFLYVTSAILFNFLYTSQVRFCFFFCIPPQSTGCFIVCLHYRRHFVKFLVNRDKIWQNPLALGITFCLHLAIFFILNNW